MKYNELSTKDRASIIGMHVASGITKLSDIEDSYNTFAGGGDISNVPNASNGFSLAPNDYNPKIVPAQTVQERQQTEYNKFKKTNPTFQQPIAKPTMLDKVGNYVQDVGSKTLNALTTFGGSAVGDVINDVSPKAANVVSKYTVGMIQPTSQEYLDSNRSNDQTNNWDNRINNSANAVSTQVGGELIGAGLGKVIEKVPQLVTDTGNLINDIPNAIPDVNLKNWTDIFKNTSKNYNVAKQKVLTKQVGTAWMDNWFSNDATKSRIAEATNAFDINNLDKDSQQKVISDYMDNRSNDLVASYPGDTYEYWHDYFEKNQAEEPESFKEDINNYHNNYNYDKQVFNNDKSDIRFSNDPKVLGSYKGYTNNGVSYPSGQAYVNKNMSLNDIKSTTIHELAHQKTSNDVTSTMQKWISDAINPDKVNTNYMKYLADPTEVNSRIFELRNMYNIKPGQVVDDNLINKIVNDEGNNIIDKKFFTLFKDKENLKNVFNKLPAYSLPIIGTKLAIDSNTPKN